MKILSRIILFIFIGIMLVYCNGWQETSEIITTVDLIGRYSASFGETDVNYFDLLPDSTYISYYQTRDGELFVDTATWGLVQRGFGRYELRIYGYINRHSEECDKGILDSVFSKGIGGDPTKMAFPVIKGRNRIKVSICFDKGWYYKKYLTGIKSE